MPSICKKLMVKDFFTPYLMPTNEIRNQSLKQESLNQEVYSNVKYDPDLDSPKPSPNLMPAVSLALSRLLKLKDSSASLQATKRTNEFKTNQPLGFHQEQDVNLSTELGPIKINQNYSSFKQLDHASDDDLNNQNTNYSNEYLQSANNVNSKNQSSSNLQSPTFSNNQFSPPSTQNQNAYLYIPSLTSNTNDVSGNSPPANGNIENAINAVQYTPIRQANVYHNNKNTVSKSSNRKGNGLNNQSQINYSSPLSLHINQLSSISKFSDHQMYVNSSNAKTLSHESLRNSNQIQAHEKQMFQRCLSSSNYSNHNPRYSSAKYKCSPSRFSSNRYIQQHSPKHHAVQTNQIESFLQSTQQHNPRYYNRQNNPFYESINSHQNTFDTAKKKNLSNALILIGNDYKANITRSIINDLLNCQSPSTERVSSNIKQKLTPHANLENISNNITKNNNDSNHYFIDNSMQFNDQSNLKWSKGENEVSRKAQNDNIADRKPNNTNNYSRQNKGNNLSECHPKSMHLATNSNMKEKMNLSNNDVSSNWAKHKEFSNQMHLNYNKSDLKFANLQVYSKKINDQKNQSCWQDFLNSTNSTKKVGSQNFTNEKAYMHQHNLRNNPRNSEQYSRTQKNNSYYFYEDQQKHNYDLTKEKEKQNSREFVTKQSNGAHDSGCLVQSYYEKSSRAEKYSKNRAEKALNDLDNKLDNQDNFQISAAESQKSKLTMKQSNKDKAMNTIDYSILTIEPQQTKLNNETKQFSKQYDESQLSSKPTSEKPNLELNRPSNDKMSLNPKCIESKKLQKPQRHSSRNKDSATRVYSEPCMTRHSNGLYCLKMFVRHPNKSRYLRILLSPQLKNQSRFRKLFLQNNKNNTKNISTDQRDQVTLSPLIKSSKAMNKSTLSGVRCPLSLHLYNLFPPPILYFMMSDSVLQALLSQVTPSSRERYLKNEILDYLSHYLRKLMGDSIQLIPIGSTAYDADSTSSDLDVVITTTFEANGLFILENISDLISVAQNSSSERGPPPFLCFKQELVQSARVPILLLKSPSGIVCDISVNTSNSICHTEFFKRVLNEKQYLRPLMRFIKYWVKIRHLPTAREGGLPSIVWMLLCVFTARYAEACYSERTWQYCNMNLLHLNCLSHFASDFTRWIWSLRLSKLPPVTSCTVLLGEFFSRLCSRQVLSCTISLAAGLSIPKVTDDVAQKLREPSSHIGVWDELLSVEDPANYDTTFYPNALIIPPEHLITRSLVAPMVLSNGIPTQEFRDLAAKISAATWLVYQYELKRSFTLVEELMLRLNYFQDNAYPQTVDVRSEITEINQLYTTLYETCHKKRYQVPANLPDLNNIKCAQCQTTFNANDSKGNNQNMAKTYQANEDLIAFATKDEKEKLNSSEEIVCCECKSHIGFKSSTQFVDIALVLLSGRLILVELNKICMDTAGWWSTEFLSRRDIRSVLHGTPMYCVKIPRQENSPYISTSFEQKLFSKSELANTRWIVISPKLFENFTKWFNSSNLPKRTLAELLELNCENETINLPESFEKIGFNACNFVCTFKGVLVHTEFGKCVELLESDIYALKNYVKLAKSAPYWYDSYANFSMPDLQPPVSECRHCKDRGIALLTLNTGLPHEPISLLNYEKIQQIIKPAESSSLNEETFSYVFTELFKVRMSPEKPKFSLETNDYNNTLIRKEQLRQMSVKSFEDFAATCDIKCDKPQNNNLNVKNKFSDFNEITNLKKMDPGLKHLLNKINISVNNQSLESSRMKFKPKNFQLPLTSQNVKNHSKNFNESQRNNFSNLTLNKFHVFKQLDSFGCSTNLSKNGETAIKSSETINNSPPKANLRRKVKLQNKPEDNVNSNNRRVDLMTAADSNTHALISEPRNIDKTYNNEQNEITKPSVKNARPINCETGKSDTVQAYIMDHDASSTLAEIVQQNAFVLAPQQNIFGASSGNQNFPIYTIPAKTSPSHFPQHKAMPFNTTFIPSELHADLSNKQQLFSNSPPSNRYYLSLKSVPIATGQPLCSSFGHFKCAGSIIGAPIATQTAIPLREAEMYQQYIDPRRSPSNSLENAYENLSVGNYPTSPNSSSLSHSVYSIPKQQIVLPQEIKNTKI